MFASLYSCPYVKNDAIQLRLENTTEREGIELVCYMYSLTRTIINYNAISFN